MKGKLTEIQKANIYEIFDILKTVAYGNTGIEIFGGLLAIKKAGEIEGIDYIGDILRSNEMCIDTARAFHIILSRYDLKITNPGIDDILMKIDRRQFAQILSIIATMDSDDIADVYENAIDFFIEHYEFLPDSIEDLVISLLQLGPETSFYYGCEGTAGLCRYPIEKGKGNNTDFYSVEINQEFSEIGRLLEFIKCGTVFTHCQDPLFEFPMKNNDIRRFDRVFMRSPIGMKWKDAEAKIMHDPYKQFCYGMPALGWADFLYASHVLKALNNTGKGIMVFPSGRLFCGGKDQRVREEMLHADVIEGVITLPAKIFRTFGIPVNLVVFNKDKEGALRHRVFFINAENMGARIRKQTVLSNQEIESIVAAYNSKKEIDEFSCLVDTDHIQDANLLPSKYMYKRAVQVEGMGTAYFDWTDWKPGKKFVELWDIATIYRGINVTGRDIVLEENGEYKIINLADVQDGELNVAGLKRYAIKNNAKIEDYIVGAGDIIITARGEQTKICCIPDIDGPILLSQNFYGIRITNEAYLPKAIELYLNSPVGQYILSKQKSGTSIPILPPRSLAHMRIPVMDLEQQQEIIAYKENKEKEILSKLQQLQKEQQRLKLDIWDEMGLTEFFKLDK